LVVSLPAKDAADLRGIARVGAAVAGDAEALAAVPRDDPQPPIGSGLNAPGLVGLERAVPLEDVRAFGLARSFDVKAFPAVQRHYLVSLIFGRQHGLRPGAGGQSDDGDRDWAADRRQSGAPRAARKH
jgi:hypothetical protein